jgi:hypothetical protein
VCSMIFPQWQHGNWLVAWKKLSCCPVQLMLCLVVVVGSVGPGVMLPLAHNRVLVKMVCHLCVCRLQQPIGALFAPLASCCTRFAHMPPKHICGCRLFDH